MSRLGRLWNEIEGSNRANCDSSNQQFGHGTFLPLAHGRGLSHRLQPYALPDLLPSCGLSLWLRLTGHQCRAAAVWFNAAPASGREAQNSSLPPSPKHRIRLARRPQTLEICVQNATNHRRMGANMNVRESGGMTMRIFIVCAILVTAAMGLGGCFWHGWHQQAVTTQPLK